jgi:hypothetical protein
VAILQSPMLLIDYKINNRRRWFMSTTSGNSWLFRSTSCHSKFVQDDHGRRFNCDHVTFIIYLVTSVVIFSIGCKIIKHRERYPTLGTCRLRGELPYVFISNSRYNFFNNPKYKGEILNIKFAIGSDIHIRHKDKQ